MNERAQSWKEEKASMVEKVNMLPAMSFWTKEEREQIEALRQDPQEAREKMTQYMRIRAENHKVEKAAMRERVQASPRKTFWTKEQRDQIEELRQDPDEAREKMTKHMKELSRTYKEQKNAISERVRALPRKTFLTPEQRDHR